EGGEGSAEGEGVQPHHQHRDKGDEKVGGKVGVDGAHGGVGQRCSVQLYHGHRPGVDDGAHLGLDGAQNDQDAGAFHTTAGGPGAGANKHQDHQQHPGQFRPSVEVRRGKAGGGDHRGHLEGGGAYSISICGHAGRYVYGNDGGGNGGDRQEEAKLITFQCLFDLAREDQEVQGKVQREQDHENGDDDLKGGVAVGAHRQ